MKTRVLLSLLSFVVCSCGARKEFAQPKVTESVEDLEELTSDDRRPNTEYVEKHYEGGQLHSRTGYWNGKREGKEWKWFPNGALMEERRYREGRKHGTHKGWWANGKPRFLAHFNDGGYEGEVRSWAPSGQLVELRSFLDGEESGLQRSWSVAGVLRANYVVRGGRRYGLLGAKPCFTVSDGIPRFKQVKG